MWCDEQLLLLWSLVDPDGHKIGPDRATDFDRCERTHGKSLIDEDDAVDFGSLTVGAPDARRIDQDFDSAADQLVASGGGDAVLKVAELSKPF